jgi:hypothetical protein
MECIAPQKPHLLRVLAVVCFISFLALQSGYSESSAALEPAAAKISSAPAPISYPPFSKIAVGITVGTFGPGLEVVTPLSRRTNLRVDGSFFNYDLSLSQDNVNYDANLKVREVRASYDFFPFHGGFRLSGGVAVYNGFNIGANAALAAGSKISLNDVDYYSSGGSNALQAKASLAYGNKVAPTFTFGWGNAIPRSGRHLAFPVEIGAAYTGVPTFNLSATGSGCAGAPCTTGSTVISATDPTFQSNLTTQRNKVINDLKPARFYPILNCGVTYRF